MSGVSVRSIDIRVSVAQSDVVGRPFGRDGLTAAMEKYDTEAAVLVSSLAVACDFRRGNEELLELIHGDDRLFGYLVVNPNHPEESIQHIRARMNSPDFLAVALFQGATAPYPKLEDYRDILSACRRFAKPVFIETVDAEAVAEAERIAAEFSTVKFIFGSMGGPDWKRAVNSARTYFNVYLETSGSYDAEKIEEAVEKAGAHRILFGSGLPFSDPASILALIQNSNISEEAMAKILGENARRLFDLPPAAPTEE